MNRNPRHYQIHFQSPADVSPPHAYHAMIRLEEIQNSDLVVRFSQEFVDREGIPEDEIVAEGFTLEDDFTWEGNLPRFWMEMADKLVKNTSWKAATQTQVLLQDPGSEDWLSPVDSKRWITFAEELIQACLEQGGKELPMELTLGKLEKNNFFEKIRLEWSFAKREVLGQLESGTKASFSLKDWEEGQDQLKAWIETEAFERGDLYQLPKSKGWYWLLNGEIWLPYKKGIKGEVWEWVEAKANL
jgi:hypothetical protein